MFGGGTDLSCGSSGDVINAIATGVVTKSQLVKSATRVLRTLFSLGLANPKNQRPFRHLGAKDIASKDTLKLAREAAQQGIVLLKNEGGILPITDKK